jgi:uncharacterized protein with HEPN domain
MVKPILLDRLRHILDSIEQLGQRTAHMELAAFKADRFLQLGAE